MPGKLVVIGRVAGRAGWQVLAAGVDDTDAAAAGQAFLAATIGARVVVCQAVRSFQSAAAVQQDAAAQVDP
jgi:hypothetical protein